MDGVVGTADENLRAMIRDMLQYGATAQLYFNYKADTLATDILKGRISVTYEGMDGFDNPNPATFEYASGKVKLIEPKKAGYTFGGWQDIDRGLNITEIYCLCTSHTNHFRGERWNDLTSRRAP